MRNTRDTRNNPCCTLRPLVHATRNKGTTAPTVFNALILSAGGVLDGVHSGRSSVGNPCSYRSGASNTSPVRANRISAQHCNAGLIYQRNYRFINKGNIMSKFEKALQAIPAGVRVDLA